MAEESCLNQLMAGNQRFVRGNPVRPHQTPDRREEVASGQSPFAAVLCCSDSRVSPELVFDCGLGDLFVTRVAGNTVNDEILGSLEYAAEQLNVSLIVVLGHKRCGAVQAAVEGGTVHGHIGNLIQALLPAVSRSAGRAGGNPVDQAARENVRLTVERMRARSPLLEDRVQEGTLQIAGGFYDLDTGAVEFLN